MADVVQGPHFSLKRIALGRSDFLGRLRISDLILDISAGDSFADIYGGPRFLIQSATKLLALRTRASLILSPQTLGPFERPWTRHLAAHIMRRARWTFARDHLSAEAARSLGVTARLDEAIDVAFRLPFEAPPRPPNGPVRVGLNVSGLLFRGGADFRLTVDYPFFVRRLLTELNRRPGHEIWLVPHVLAPDHPDDDVTVSRDLCNEFPAVRLAPPFRSSIEAKSFIAGLDFFCGARMHACIAAFSSGVPVVPFAYSRKFQGLFHTLGYLRLVDGRTETTAASVDAVLAGLDERQAAARDIAPCLDEAQRRLALYEDRLAAIMREVAG